MSAEESESHDEWTAEELEQIGERVQVVLQQAVEETADLDVAAAAGVLRERLNQIEGVEFELDWAMQVIEGLRRGDEVTIELG